MEQFSPDPEYDRKVRRLGACLRAAAADPERVVAVFVDEMGYTRWPDPGPDWGALPPADPPRAERFDSPNRLWRVNAFFAQFARGSNALLRYVGLLGDGKLARWLHPKRATDVARRN